MRKLVSYMFTSLDGFIADRDRRLDWTARPHSLLPQFMDARGLPCADADPDAVAFSCEAEPGQPELTPSADIPDGFA